MKPYESLTYRGQIARLRRLAREALEAYALPSFRLTILQHEDNTTFRVDAATGERYALRIHHFEGRSAEAVSSELKWLTALRQEGFCVPEPVPTRTGEFLTIIKLDGIASARITVLFRWVKGRFFDSDLTASHMEQVGVLMARLHEHALHFNLGEGFVRERVDVITDEERDKLARGISAQKARAEIDFPEDEARALHLLAEFASPEDVARASMLIQKMREVQREARRGSQAFGVIHADLHEDNFLFDGEQVCVIDFDDCGFGDFLYDMAVPISEIRTRADGMELRSAFLAGYRTIRPFSAEDERHLETFIAFRDLQIMLWIYNLRNQPRFRERWQRITQRMLQRLKLFFETDSLVTQSEKA